MSQEEKEAIQKTLSGSREAFGYLVDKYSPALSARAYSDTGSVSEAQEAVQEAFVIAFSRLASLRDHDSFGPWLYRILKNITARDFRLKQRQRQYRDKQQEQESNTGETDNSLITLIKGEEAKQLRRAVDQLPETMKEVILLRFWGGLNRTEAANLLEIDQRTFDKRQERAYQQLRKLMKE